MSRIVLVALLLAGCSSNDTELDELEWTLQQARKEAWALEKAYEESPTLERFQDQQAASVVLRDSRRAVRAYKAKKSKERQQQWEQEARLHECHSMGLESCSEPIYRIRIAEHDSKGCLNRAPAPEGLRWRGCWGSGSNQSNYWEGKRLGFPWTLSELNTNKPSYQYQCKEKGDMLRCEWNPGKDPKEMI